MVFAKGLLYIIQQAIWEGLGKSETLDVLESHKRTDPILPQTCPSFPVALDPLA